MGEPLTSWAWYVGSQSWREAMCCAATQGVQLSRIFSYKRHSTVQHNSLASRCPYIVVSLPLFVCFILHRYLSKREGCTVSSFLTLCPSFIFSATVNVKFWSPSLWMEKLWQNTFLHETFPPADWHIPAVHGCGVRRSGSTSGGDQLTGAEQRNKGLKLRKK